MCFSRDLSFLSRARRYEADVEPWWRGLEAYFEGDAGPAKDAEREEISIREVCVTVGNGR